MENHWLKRVSSAILAGVMALHCIPMATFAAETDGLCPHHTQHTEACGYSAAAQGHDCGHAHTDECYQSVTECVHTHGECGYVPAVEGQDCECQPDENGEIVHTDGCGFVEAVAEVPCGHDCSEENGCVTKELNCQHQHDDVCGYVKEVAETPCGFECSDCAKEAVNKEAANRVAALITALPTVDAVKAKPMEAQEVDYNQVQAAYDAYSELTDEQKTLITNAEETFEALFNYFNALVSVDGEIGSGTPDGTPPTLTSLAITSATTITAPGTVELVAEATDDVSGVAVISAYFAGQNNGKYLECYLSQTYWDRETGESIAYPDGKFHGEIKIDQYLETDTFILESVSARDNAGNTTHYHRDYDENWAEENRLPLTDYMKEMQFSVSNTGADVTTSVSKPTFVEEVTNAANDAYIVADFSGNPTLPKDAFDGIANTDKTLDLTSEGVTWRFEGSDITNTTKDIDLSVQITKAESNTSDVGQVIQDKLNDNPGYIMKFAENGTLPGKATIQIKVDYAMREHLGSSTGLNVYYYNNQTGELELIAQNLTVINDTYVEFEITHCSYYVLTAADAASDVQASGTCGENLTWALDESGTLTISGTGEMTECKYSVDYPWYEWSSYVRKIYIADGVTSIGTNAFSSKMTDLVSIELGKDVSSVNTITNGIEAYYVADDNKYYSAVDGVLFNKERTIIVRYPSKKSASIYNIRDGVTKIDIFAFTFCNNLTSITLPTSVTTIGSQAFFECRNLKAIEIPNSVTCLEGVSTFLGCTSLDTVVLSDNISEIPANAFSECVSLKSITIPDKITYIGEWAFRNCAALESVTFSGDAPSFSSECFLNTESIAYYPANNPTWTNAVMQNYGGNITWQKNDAGNILNLQNSGLETASTVWIDGIAYPVQKDNAGVPYVEIPDNAPPVLVTYSYNNNSDDRHTQYPTGMQAYRIHQTSTGSTVVRLPELDNLLQYSGSSIRITGNKGIRMITSVNQDTRNTLTGNGLAGYKLLEYGTLLAQTSKLGNNPLVLGGANVKSNYAYKKGVADPVFKYTNGLIQYTNVLVGFTDEQCKEDIAMRPYMKLQDESGEEFVIYGGIVYRSIGYIAYQNRNAFQPGSAAYEYVWSIIHNVYGNQYDSEYKK